MHWETSWDDCLGGFLGPGRTSTNFFNFKIFGDKIFGDKKKVRPRLIFSRINGPIEFIAE